jgi:hypothetical protein
MARLAPGGPPRGRAQAQEPGRTAHVVSDVLGHASIAITKDVYGRLLDGDKRAAAESMRRALFGSWDAPVAPRMRYALEIPYTVRESSAAEILALRKASARAAG